MALAEVTSLPSTAALSSTNLYRTPFREPHETVWMPAVLYCCAV